MEALSFTSSATNTTLTTSSVAIAIPDDASGKNPKFCYIACDGDAYFKPGFSGDTIASGGGPLIRSGAPLIIKTGGFTHIIAIGDAGSELLNIAPLENG